MIKRNDVNNDSVSLETDNDRARIAIKKGLLTFGCITAAIFCAMSYYRYAQRQGLLDLEAQNLIDMTEAIEIPVWREPSAGFGPDTAADMALAGMDVAGLQSSYFDEDSDMLAVQDALRSYFDDSSGELRWFSAGESAQGLFWQYEEGSGLESGTERAIWSLYDSDDRLCAYVMADYDMKTGKFYDAKCYVTTYGYEQSIAVDVPSDGGDEGYDENYDFMSDPESRLDNNREVSADELDKE